MATIPSYSEWKSTTNLGAFHKRSTELKRVDSALEDYWKKPDDAQKKKTLRDAFDAWIGSKGTAGTSRDATMVKRMQDALRPYRAATAAWTAEALPVKPVAGKVYLGQSFEHANSRERHDVPAAFGRAKELIHVAYIALQQARTAGANRDIYTTWFGAYTQARFNTVNTNVRAIYDALFMKPVVLYYRGNDVEGPSDCPAEAGTDATPGSYFGAAWKPANLPVSLNKAYTYIFLGSAFFTSGVYESDATGGVLIHESTHAICGTDDVLYRGVRTYGHALCKRLATEQPDLAINNADCYEYMCENYQNRLFQPVDLALNLSPKASITLPMRAPS